MLIITGSDDNYAIGVMVLIASAALHNPHARFAVLDLDISAENRARIDALGSRLGVEVTRIVVDAAQIAHLPVFSSYVTVSTCLRLLIPQLFPAEERALYMDCDMLCTGPLEEIWATEFGDALIAAVQDPSDEGADFLIEESASLGVALADYVNAGLLMMNLTRWRSEGIDAQCLELIAGGTLKMADQSAINRICNGRKHKLPERYNMVNRHKYGFARKAKETPRVLHYTGPEKPWKIGDGPLARVWHAYAALIGDMLPPFTPTLRRPGKLEQWNYQRKIFGYRFSDPARYARYKDTQAMQAETLHVLEAALAR